jgi:hypothetical protein
MASSPQSTKDWGFLTQKQGTFYFLLGCGCLLKESTFTKIIQPGKQNCSESHPGLGDREALSKKEGESHHKYKSKGGGQEQNVGIGEKPSVQRGEKVTCARSLKEERRKSRREVKREERAGQRDFTWSLVTSLQRV